MPTVLSIQSHVIAGSVGHGAATPALSTWNSVEVWPLPTVVLSNHAATKGVTGRRLTGVRIAELADGLSASGALDRLDGVLTGYLGTASAGNAVADLVEQVKTKRPDALYLCDPVLGDTGPGLYLPSRVGAIYRRRLLPLADIATPNLFELGWLTRTAPATLAEIGDAADTLRGMGPNRVVVTSVPGEPGRIGIMAVGPEGRLWCDGPAAPAHLNGAGDFVAAFLLGRMMGQGDSLHEAAMTTLATVASLAATAVRDSRDDLPVHATDVAVSDDIAVTSLT